MSRRSQRQRTKRILEEEREDLTEEAAAVFGEDANGTISMATTVNAGWQCSYRRTAPEQRSFSDWNKRWTRQRAKWEGFALAAPQEKHSVEAQLARQKIWQDRRRVKPR